MPKGVLGAHIGGNGLSGHRESKLPLGFLPIVVVRGNSNLMKRHLGLNYTPRNISAFQ